MTLHFSHRVACRHFPAWGILVLLSLVAGLLAGCSSSPGTGQVGGPPELGPGITLERFASVTIAVPEERRLGRVEIIPSHLVVVAGEVSVFSAIAYDTQGREMGDVRFVWGVEEARAGSISPNGVFQAGREPGTHLDAVTVRGIQQSSSGLVEAQGVASVSIVSPATSNALAALQVFPDLVEAEPGESVTLTPIPMDRNGLPLPGVEFQWDLREPDIGSLDARGRFRAGNVEGVFPNAIRIVGRQPEGPATSPVEAFVTVRIFSSSAARKLTRLEVLPQSITLSPDDEFTFAVLALDRRGHPLVEAQVEWSLRQPEAGRIDADGRFHASSIPGIYPAAVEARVTVTRGELQEQVSATATVAIVEAIAPTVGDGAPLHVALLPQTLVLAPGDSTRLTLVGLDGNGRVLRDVTTHWSVSGDVAAITQQGTVTAGDRPGRFTDAITVEVIRETEQGVVRKRVSSTLLILGPLTQLDILPQEITLAPGAKRQLAFAAFDGNGLPLTDVNFSWEVVDPQVGRIDSRGVFTAGNTAGEYPDAIRLTVFQVWPPASATR